MLEMMQLDLKDRRVLIREDLNVPMKDGKILDKNRIQRALPTLKAALSKGAKVIVMSHFGRPGEGIFDDAYSLAPIAQQLKESLDYPVRFAKDWIDGVSVNAGELVLCENVRFLTGEKSNATELAKKMAALCDVFVMDAFATAHRVQASTVGVAEYAKVACAGPLLIEELHALETALDHPKKPLLAIVGGAKVSSKMDVLLSLIDRVDAMIVGGGMANTFLKAAGHEVGDSLYEEDWLPRAREFMQQTEKSTIAVPLPTDVVVGKELVDDAVATEKSIDDVASDDKILDIGKQTIATYKELIAQAGTIVWNGPVGVFEIKAYRQGTEQIAEAVAASPAFSIAGGGDTVAAIELFGLKKQISYISTGGGAFLEFLEGRELPAVAILNKRGGDETA